MTKGHGGTVNLAMLVLLLLTCVPGSQAYVSAGQFKLTMLRRKRAIVPDEEEDLAQQQGRSEAVAPVQPEGSSASSASSLFNVPAGWTEFRQWLVHGLAVGKLSFKDVSSAAFAVRGNVLGVAA